MPGSLTPLPSLIPMGLEREQARFDPQIMAGKHSEIGHQGQHGIVFVLEASMFAVHHPNDRLRGAFQDLLAQNGMLNPACGAGPKTERP